MRFRHDISRNLHVAPTGGVEKRKKVLVPQALLLLLGVVLIFSSSSVVVVPVVVEGFCYRTHHRPPPQRQLITGIQRRNNHHKEKKQTQSFVRHSSDSSVVISLQAKKATKTSTSSSATARSKRVSNLRKWADDVDIKIGGVTVQQSQESDTSGLGIVADRELKSGDLIMTVPSDVVLSVEIPGEGPDDTGVSSLLEDSRDWFRKAPWYVQFSLYLNKLDKIDASKKNNEMNMRPWLDSLPRSFDTPIHWSVEQRDALLQYKYLSDAIQKQEQQWKQWHRSILDNISTPTPTQNKMTWEDFLWGCECARSRAFSGGYTGSAFNPYPFAFTLLLVTAYIGLGLGTIEQAANGAGVVFCAAVFQNFIIPKLFNKKKRYIISPLIDMTNHKSVGTTCDVSFEFFGDAYSLAVTSASGVPKGSELYISYGTRSNDQLLQYYGFVENDNPHDVYVMPPIRDWDIAALEKACGKPFAPGRLQKLDRAGLLGGKNSNNSDETIDDENDESLLNASGGVVITRAGGIDPAIMQAIRVLVSTEEEWDNAQQAVGSFAEEFSGGNENERLARFVARTAIELELANKPTTLDEDLELFKKNRSGSSMIEEETTAERLGTAFRIEKKKLLLETIDKLR